MKTPEFDAQVLLEIQAGFGALVMENPRLTKYVNNLGPALFATCLFTLAQDFKVSEDGETVEARHGLTEATQIAKDLIQQVADAFGAMDPVEEQLVAV